MTEETKKPDISLKADLYFPLGEDGNFSARYKPEPERAQVSFNRMMEYVAANPTAGIFLHHSGDKKLALDENTTLEKIIDAIKEAQKPNPSAADNINIRRRNNRIHQILTR